MRKTTLLGLFLFFQLCAVQSQSIIDVQAYGKTDGSRFVALLSDQTLWWYSDNQGWQKVSMDGLPAGNGIKYFNSYVKFSMSAKNTRLVAVLQDNSIWWYNEGSSWEKVPDTGLPKNGSIKIFRPYIKPASMGGMDTRFVIIMDDNSIWWHANNNSWKSVPAAGLPANYNIDFLGTYQKVSVMGTETRYVITLADKSMWWYADNAKKWQQLETSGLPLQHGVKQFDAYMKIGGSVLMATTFEGRLITVLGDESIWWYAVNGREWKKLDVSGLPKGYKIKTLKVYQKHPGMFGETRVIVALDDNSIWWYAEGKPWEPVSMNGLNLSH